MVLVAKRTLRGSSWPTRSIVARTYMAKMGGNIEVCNEEDGVTFIMSLLWARKTPDSLIAALISIPFTHAHVFLGYSFWL